MYCPVRCFGFNQRSCRKPKPKSPNASRTPHSCAPVQPDEKTLCHRWVENRSRVPNSRKKLWDYIKKHGCQDKKKRTMINADDSLKPVFNGKSQVSMFEMTKLVSGHIK